MRTRVLALLVWIQACGAAGANNQVAPMPEITPPTDAGPRVEVARVTPSNINLTLDLPGEVAGFRDVLVSASMGGLVESVSVKTGDTVAKGQVLFVVDRGALSAQLAQAEAQLRLAEAEQARAVQMGDLATPAERDARKAQVDIAAAGVRLVRNQLEHTTTRSPIQGVVAAIDIDAGEYAAPGQPVGRVVQLDPVKVSLSVSDRDVVALERGMSARVRTASTNEQKVGTVAQVGSAADLSTRTFLVEVEVPNSDHSLLPGMIAKVEVDRQLASGSIVVPQDWLVTRVEGYGLFVLDGDVARWRSVQLGEVVRGQVVISSGVVEGDRVVMTGQHGLADGDKVLVSREGACCTDGRATF